MEIVYENKTEALTMQFGSGLSGMIHLHKELELIYVESGKAVAYADKNSYILNKGDVFITFPNQIHYYETIEDGSFAVIIFSSKIVYGFSDIISKSVPDRNYIPCGEVEGFDYIFNRVTALSGDYTELALNGYINVLMSRILPILQLKTVNAENNTALYNVIDYCTNNFKEEITLDSIAEKLHLSKYYISHMINRKLNQNFNEYINNLRIAEACNLLRETNIKIADISEDVGFGTIRSFNRAFKQITGISPAVYREKNAVLKKLI